MCHCKKSIHGSKITNVSCLLTTSVISLDQSPSRWHYLITTCCRQSLWQVGSQTPCTTVYPLITKPLTNKYTANYDLHTKCMGENSSVEMTCHIWKRGLVSSKDLKVMRAFPPTPDKHDHCTDTGFTDKQLSLGLLSMTKIMFKLGRGVL